MRDTSEDRAMSIEVRWTMAGNGGNFSPGDMKPVTKESIKKLVREYTEHQKLNTIEW